MKKYLSIIIVFVFISCNSKIKNFRCIDGDTIVLQSGERVRLCSIDSPELSQFYGLRARQELILLTAGKCITLKRKGKDRYNRTLGELFYNDTCINEEMVLLGYAWSYKKDLISDQQQAQSKRLGMWRYTGNIEPYLFRKEHKH